MPGTWEFCICDGADTEFCPFHDPRILKMKAESDKQKEEERDDK